MKSILEDILAAVFWGMILPGILLNTLVMFENQQEKKKISQITLQQNEEMSIPVQLREEKGTLVQLDLEDYLVGVVLAEMPASFESEALKAQAVAARTYTCKTMQTGGKHGDGSLCGQSVCCQAYISPEAYLQNGGVQTQLDKIRSAVTATRGYVLTYEGELIEATYFSCSGGKTEDALAVWGADYPYLQSVESPGEENAAHYTDTVCFTPAEFQRALGTELPEEQDFWFGPVSYTEGGGVAAMEIGGQTYSGTRLRELLGLRSTAFTVERTPDSIRITTRGYGHRVGMSQYGAEAMAVSGILFPEILSHYYPGTQLRSYEKRAVPERTALEG